jgi:hypothetical protein
MRRLYGPRSSGLSYVGCRILPLVACPMDPAGHGRMLPGMFRRHVFSRPAVTPAAVARRRMRRVGLRRALEMLETGERINDRLYRWTITPGGVSALAPGLA